MQSETRAAEAHEFRLASLAKELEAALSESIENENSLRAEAEDLRERLNGAREEAASAQERQNRLVAAEAAAREAEIRGLQAQLDEQVKILRDCEAALKNSAKRQLEELAGKDAELRQREELDAGLRELVGVRENQAQQLTSRVEQLQRQLKDRDSEASLASSEISSLKTRLEEQEQMLLEQKRKARALEADATEGKAALAEVASLRNRLKVSEGAHFPAIVEPHKQRSLDAFPRNRTPRFGGCCARSPRPRQGPAVPVPRLS